MLTTVAAQSGRLQSAGEKMKGVLSNINLSGNILQMLKTRTKSDNRLILVLSVGLVFEILLCIFVIRPYLRGS